MAAPAHHPVVGKLLLQLLEDIDKPVAFFDFHYRLESLWQEAGGRFWLPSRGVDTASGGALWVM